MHVDHAAGEAQKNILSVLFWAPASVGEQHRLMCQELEILFHSVMKWEVKLIFLFSTFKALLKQAPISPLSFRHIVVYSDTLCAGKKWCLVLFSSRSHFDHLFRRVLPFKPWFFSPLFSPSLIVWLMPSIFHLLRISKTKFNHLLIQWLVDKRCDLIA